MKTASETRLNDYFLSLQSTWDVRVPLLLPDGTRGLGSPGAGPLALGGGALHRKPTEVFFPQQAPMLRMRPDGSCSTPPGGRPLLVVGFTAEDLDCLEYVDGFFSRGLPDDLYLARRKGALVMGISGRCGPSGEMLRIAGGKCDVELVGLGDRFALQPWSETGRSLLETLEAADETLDMAALVAASDALPQENLRLLERASQLLLEGRVPDSFWTGIAERCIACTGCNLVCPTCTCYGVQDWVSAKQTERIRLWDSCQLDGFMREAGGHNPLGTEGARTRRRIHHKLAADVLRHGRMSCFLCGRCDAACPTGIGILAVAREMVERYG